LTLIVALPDKAQLVYVDTVDEKEIRRVDLPFKPDLLAVQGKQLFASVYGGNSIHSLDLSTGVNRKELRLPAGPLTGLACNHAKGPLFASIPDPTKVGAVVAISPTTGALAYTAHNLPSPPPMPPMNRFTAQGPIHPLEPKKVAALTIAADPSNPEGFYSIVYITGGRHATHGVGVLRVGVRDATPYRPYSGPPYKPSFNDPQAIPVGLIALADRFQTSPMVGTVNTAVHASGDGRHVGILDLGGNGITLLSSQNLDEKIGMMDCPHASDFAFHPVLDLAVAEGDESVHKKDRAFFLFNGKSLVEVARFPLGHGPSQEDNPNGRLLTFGGRGTKIVYYDPSRGHRLRFFPLSLSEKDKETLEKAFHPGHK
jgi:hypothetical protein